MKLWPFGRTETRESHSDQILSLMVNRATGATGSNRVGAYEAAAGLWARAFSVATVTPETAITAGLDPYTLACMGRALCTSGQWLAEVTVDDGGVFLDAADNWEITGDGIPSTWEYTLTFDRPSASVRRVLPAGRVVHVRLPGPSPLVGAQDTVNILSRLDVALAAEVSGPVGYLMPVPAGKKDQLAGDIKSLKGQLGVVETSNAYADKASAPAKDFEAIRVGPHPPEVLIKLRESAERSIFAAAGVPPLTSNIDGTSQRESLRRFLHSTLTPVGVIAARELSVKLDTPGLTFAFDKLFAADLSGRARAFQSMVGGGIDVTKAAALAGLMEAE